MQAEAKERIIQFFQCTQKKPTRIVIYRDGVAEGQFLTVTDWTMNCNFSIRITRSCKQGCTKTHIISLVAGKIAPVSTLWFYWQSAC